MSYEKNIGFGFTQGINKVSKQRIESWLRRPITWYPFLWYLAETIIIQDFDNDSVDVLLRSEKECELFYKVTKRYQEELMVSNYELDTQNDLWMDHHRGKDKNRDILERLVVL